MTSAFAGTVLASVCCICGKPCVALALAHGWRIGALDKAPLLAGELNGRRGECSCVGEMEKYAWMWATGVFPSVMAVQGRLLRSCLWSDEGVLLRSTVLHSSRGSEFVLCWEARVP